MAARWVRLGYVEPIDKKNVPNFANLVDNLKTINYDPKREYTLPWQSGATGIGYNIKKTGRELKSVKDLFDPKFKGKVTMLSEPYDSASTVLLGDGIDASKATLDQLLGAIEKIDKANKAGQFRQVHRQRLHDRPRQGRHVGRARLLGRHGAAAVRQPGPALRLRRGGLRRSSPTT